MPPPGALGVTVAPGGPPPGFGGPPPPGFGAPDSALQLTADFGPQPLSAFEENRRAWVEQGRPRQSSPNVWFVTEKEERRNLC